MSEKETNGLGPSRHLPVVLLARQSERLGTWETSFPGSRCADCETPCGGYQKAGAPVNRTRNQSRQSWTNPLRPDLAEVCGGALNKAN